MNLLHLEELFVEEKSKEGDDGKDANEEVVDGSEIWMENER